MEVILRGKNLALIAAVISGFSVFLNSFAVKVIPNSYFFTTVKNISVAFILLSIFLIANKWPAIKNLKRKDWLNLITLGIIGGSIPFLLFFQGLSISSNAAINGAFIHKTLFIWVAVTAFFFLKEKFSLIQYSALVIMVFGLYFAGGIKNFAFSTGEFYILLAVLLWSLEAVFVKKRMMNIESNMAALGRMFFGAVIMLAFLIVTGNKALVLPVSSSQIGWILITSLFLFCYVTYYYKALYAEKVTVVTSILTLAFPITVLCQNAYKNLNYLDGFLVFTPLFLGLIVFLFLPKLAEKAKIFRHKYGRLSS